MNSKRIEKRLMKLGFTLKRWDLGLRVMDSYWIVSENNTEKSWEFGNLNDILLWIKNDDFRKNWPMAGQSPKFSI